MWSKTITIGHQSLQFEIGEIARQANASVLVRCGKAVLLTTVCASDKPSSFDFLPLTVNYGIRHAAAGRIPGSFKRREGRGNDAEILTARIIDRSIRPLFPKDYRYDTQIVATLLSYDPEVDADGLALCSTAMALAVSDLPFDGPLAGYRLGFQDDEWIFGPGRLQRQELDLDIVISAKREGLVMTEGRAQEVPESCVLEAFQQSKIAFEALFEAIDEAQKHCGQSKRSATIVAPTQTESEVSLPDGYPETVKTRLEALLKDPVACESKASRKQAFKDVEEALFADFAEDEAQLEAAKSVYESQKKALIRAQTLDAKRLDGRPPECVRDISGKVSWLPSPHGSSLFCRGETQAMVTCTLGSDRDAQMIDHADGLERQRFLLHYNFPPYCVGEARPMRGPGRREIGHGFLAWNALSPVLPGHEEFPYTVRLDSIITESNGSSSMATVCGGCLALMDAGVPIRAPVAGIAMGLMKEGDRFVVLSDILGDEDHLGDMDFKVAGTTRGVTAIQLDNKIGSLPDEVMSQAFEQAKAGRLHILDRMASVLESPREAMREDIPRARSWQIPMNRMRDLIGPGGKNIRGVEAESECTVSVDDDGIVRVFAPSDAALTKAVEMIEDLTGLPKVGQQMMVQVVDIKPFGAVVRLFEGIEGTIRAEELGQRRLQMGARVAIKVLGADSRGHVQVTLA